MRWPLTPLASNPLASDHSLVRRSPAQCSPLGSPAFRLCMGCHPCAAADGLKRLSSSASPRPVALSAATSVRRELGRLPQLRNSLAFRDSLALLPGNHDGPPASPGLQPEAEPVRLFLAPRCLPLGRWRLILLSSHQRGSTAEHSMGPLDCWMPAGRDGRSTWVPSTTRRPIGAQALLALQQPERLLTLLRASRRSRVVFGPRAPALAGRLPGRPEGAPARCPSQPLRHGGRPGPAAWTRDPGGTLLNGTMGCWRRSCCAGSAPP